MNSVEYLRPTTIAEAVAAAAVPGAAYLAAGTNLVDLMKSDVVRPSRLVDVGCLPGLTAIEHLPDGGLRIGALVRNVQLAQDDGFAERFPAVAEALRTAATGPLRNAATVGGNLLQRTRCAYFYDTASACNKRNPGAGCDAVGGQTRTHAVLGWSPSCIATHPSDFCVPLVAMDAVVELEGMRGRRKVALEAFHCLPGVSPERESVLQPGELIVAVRLPPAAAAFAGHARYLKVRDRTSHAFAVVSAAAALRLKDGRIAEARIALGGVALKPWRARAAEAVLVGAIPHPALFQGAAGVALVDAKPSGDNEYKIELARRIVTRALIVAARDIRRTGAGVPGYLPWQSRFTATAGLPPDPHGFPETASAADAAGAQRPHAARR